MGCHGSYPFTFLNLSELAEQVSLPPLPETEESASPGWNQLSPVRALSAHPASYKTSRPVSKLEEDPKWEKPPRILGNYSTHTRWIWSGNVTIGINQ